MACMGSRRWSELAGDAWLSDLESRLTHEKVQLLSSRLVLQQLPPSREGWGP